MLQKAIDAGQFTDPALVREKDRLASECIQRVGPVVMATLRLISNSPIRATPAFEK